MASMQKRKTNGVSSREGMNKMVSKQMGKIDKNIRRREVATGEATADLGIVTPWSTFSELRKLDFGELCERRQKLDDEIKFRTEKKKELDEEISAALALAGVEKVQWEDRPIQIVHKEGGSKLVPERLLEHGVPADVIAECTGKGKPSSYLLFGKPKA
jgi:hypothetical protein